VTSLATSENANAAAVAAMRAGRLSDARAILEAALASRTDDVSLWLNLAGVCRALNDIPAAFAAVEGALRAQPRSFPALLMKASLLERQGETTQAGIGYGLALTQAPAPDKLDPATRRAFDHAREVHDAYVAGLRERLVEATSGAAGIGRSEEGRRIEAFIDHMVGRRRIFQQQPSAFYYPGLPSIEFYPREMFPWLEQVEAATPAIQGELAAIFADDKAQAGFAPYVAYAEGLPLDRWAELNHSPRWNAFHILKDGVPVPDNAQRCPATLQAMTAAPIAELPGRSPAAMFSVLQPKTRIPPHTGVSNTRLVVHLALVIPEGCGFRVGNETREWRSGEAFVFDDTLEHEAWNESDRTRTVLIFDIWSPFLSVTERDMIRRVTEAADAFNGGFRDGHL
jgi:aspartyl/asparaginyl beta-hydroxylase (cupin superfamily)